MAVILGGSEQALGEAPEVARAPWTLEIVSTADASVQRSLFWPCEASDPRPLLVVLHWWSASIDTYDPAPWLQEAAARKWHLLLPDFRGPNLRPEACGSKLARQDILDAVDHVIATYRVDEARIYLAGESGGGHMAMVMAAETPNRWAAVSEWSGISDLAAWHAETKAAGRRYWENIEAVAGGAPGSSKETDKTLHYRSPVHFLGRTDLPPIDFNTGIRDGHEGSVPVHHTVDTFNIVARTLGGELVDAATLEALSSRTAPVLSKKDPTYGRDLYLRRKAGASRVTIFEGGHEGLPAAACAWLALHVKKDRELHPVQPETP